MHQLICMQRGEREEKKYTKNRINNETSSLNGMWNTFGACKWHALHVHKTIEILEYWTKFRWMPMYLIDFKRIKCLKWCNFRITTVFCFNKYYIIFQVVELRFNWKLTTNSILVLEYSYMCEEKKNSSKTSDRFSNTECMLQKPWRALYMHWQTPSIHIPKWCVLLYECCH